MIELLEPLDIVIDGKDFVISKFPAIGGREIVVKYLSSSLPKIGDYEENEKMMFKLMNYVGVRSGDNIVRLTTPALINNHVGDWERCLLVEAKIMEYNCRFFREGRVSTFLNDVALKVPAWTTKIWTALSGRLSPTEKQPSMS